ncbi:MAG TPA: hypothetical protein VFQ38_00440, partial [Longimicrobiales bacterium]|nr:hypothetical protein [Longimicrobiales bacterium]
PLLVQVSLDTEGDETWKREVAALASASREYPEATALLVTADSSPPMRELPGSIRWRSAAEWLLEVER